MIRYKNPRIRITGEDYCQPKMALMLFPHCGIEGWAGAIAIGVGAAGSALAASSAASAQEQANQINAQNVANTNQLNYQQFLQGRGSTGSAIYPIYASDAEAAMYRDTMATYNATGALQPTAAQYQNIVNAALPAQLGANATVAGVFNGQTLNQEQQNIAPVNQANLDAVATQKQGTLEALQSTLNNIKAIQAGKGYNGDSFGTQLLNFQARQGANTTSSNALSQAKITNAQNIYGLKENDINRQLQNVNLPSAMATNNANLLSMPANALESNMAQRQQLFQNFKIGTNQFTYQNLPTVQPVPNAGMIAGQAVGSVAGSVGNYLANQQLMSALSRNPTSTNTMPYSIGSGVPVQQGEQVDSVNIPPMPNYTQSMDEEAALRAGGL